MKRILVAVMFLGLSGCGMLGSTDIRCWYVRAETQSVSEPWLRIVGRTDKFHDDVYGAMFKSQVELDGFLNTHHLAMCGAAK